MMGLNIPPRRTVFIATARSKAAASLGGTTNAIRAGRKRSLTLIDCIVSPTSFLASMVGLRGLCLSHDAASPLSVFWHHRRSSPWLTLNYTLVYRTREAKQGSGESAWPCVTEPFSTTEFATQPLPAYHGAIFLTYRRTTEKTTMNAQELLALLGEGTTLEGPHWTEPVKVVTAKARGPRIEVQAVDLNTKRLWTKLLNPTDFDGAIKVTQAGQLAALNGNPTHFRLAAEAHRIRLPHFAVSVSQKVRNCQ